MYVFLRPEYKTFHNSLILNFLFFVIYLIKTATIWAYLKDQIEKMDQKKCTLDAWAPSSHGYSIPSVKIYPTDFYHPEAERLIDLMKGLDYQKYFMLKLYNWRTIALVILSRYPDYSQIHESKLESALHFYFYKSFLKKYTYIIVLFTHIFYI